MESFDLPLALVSAMVSVAVFTRAWVWVVRYLRTREYQRQKRLDQELATHDPPVTPAPAFVDAGAWVRPLHQASIEKQNAYYDCLTRSVAALALALIALILGLTFFVGDHWYSTFSASVEVLAFSYVLYQFWIGRRINKDWVEARARSEIMRQAGVVMATAATAAGAATLDVAEKAKWDAIAQTPIASHPTGDDEFADLVHGEWIKHQPDLSNYVANLNAASFETYLAYRARRQLRWFQTAIKRLQNNHARRETMLRIVFGLCVLVALAKLVFSMPQFHMAAVTKSWILVALFVAAAWASAYTAFYLSNNQRSLFHRYNTQVRQIREWLRQCDTLKTQHPFNTSEAQRQVMWFEALMEGELIDWINITHHDSMEIAPG
jgi:hypothetical protein